MKHYLSICAILKNERPYLREWVEHHLKQGVEHFYLYDNGSEDTPREVVTDYHEQGMITWHQVFGIGKQREAYDHCIGHHKEDTEWCAFIDIDEFLWSVKNITVRDDIRAKYEIDNVSVIAVHWLLFGSCGHTAYDAQPVVQRFTRRAAAVNPHVKSIVRMSDAICMANDAHTFRVKNTAIDENYNELAKDYALSSPATASVLAINHYVTKSRQECLVRRATPRADSGAIREQGFFEAHDCNDVEDLRLARMR